MPPSLPSKLLLAIFELAIPSIRTVSECEQRQKTFLNLCLVSCRFHDIAQPLLWRIFRPKEDKLHVAASFPRLAKHIYVFEPREKIRHARAIFKAVEHMPQLVDFRLTGYTEVSKPKFHTISHLEHLFLDDMQIASFASVVFRNLATFTFHNVWPFRNSEGVLLPAASFPNLKDLFSTSQDYNSSTRKTSMVEPVGLGNQLDMMRVVLWRLGCGPSDLLDRDVPVLLTFGRTWPGELSSESHFEHFQLDAWRDSDLEQLSSAHPKPREALRKPAPDQHTLRDNLLSTCAARKIDIIWRLNSKDYVDDLGVSKEFWRCAKVLKRKKALEAEGGGGGSRSA
ncbi:hypothetical protein JCM8547_007031 [Rhodosporidiobolus lusitaniae]